MENLALRKPRREAPGAVASSLIWDWGSWTWSPLFKPPACGLLFSQLNTNTLRTALAREYLLH